MEGLSCNEKQKGCDDMPAKAWLLWRHKWLSR